MENLSLKASKFFSITYNYNFFFNNQGTSLLKLQLQFHIPSYSTTPLYSTTKLSIFGKQISNCNQVHYPQNREWWFRKILKTRNYDLDRTKALHEIESLLSPFPFPPSPPPPPLQPNSRVLMLQICISL